MTRRFASRISARPHAAAIVAAAALLSLNSGCPQPSSDGEFLDKEGNFSFDNATPLNLPDSGPFEFTGEISSSNDVDVFSLGGLAAGEKVVTRGSFLLKTEVLRGQMGAG